MTIHYVLLLLRLNTITYYMYIVNYYRWLSPQEGCYFKRLEVTQNMIQKGRISILHCLSIAIFTSFASTTYFGVSNSFVH